MNLKYMELAITLANKGRGFVNPNPCVGAVIVKDNQIIGQGYHHKYGDLHAERDAFANLTEDASGAQMYVTLEPCCHYGKQPPCTQAIIEHGIKTVYVGSSDPNKLVSGKGIDTLRKHGITVVEHVMKEQCDALNPVFFHYITRKTPYVALKYAMTLDGKIATHTGESQWITGAAARSHAHMLRHEFSSIMVGIETVLKDDPMLNCRLKGYTSPIRVICDSHLRVPLTAKLIQTARDYPSYITYVSTPEVEKKQDMIEKKAKLEAYGVHLLGIPPKDNRISIEHLMLVLGENNIDSILLEGGGTLNESFLKHNLINHVYTYIAPKFFGGTGKFTPVGGSGVTHPDDAYLFHHTKTTILEKDILLEYDPDLDQC